MAGDTREDILESGRRFDINAPLTDEELELFGMLTTGTAPKEDRSVPSAVVLDEEVISSVDAVEKVSGEQDYNERYAYYLRCQALVTLSAFEEGWKALEDLVLVSYVRARRRENESYRGDDPNRAFSLRLKQQAAEDFVMFIRAVVAEAAAMPKPVLEKK